MSPETSTEVVQEMISALVKVFPTPWRVEADWGFEVLDSRGVRVALFSKPETAKELVEKAAAHDLYLKQCDEDLDKVLNAELTINIGGHEYPADILHDPGKYK